MLYDPSYLGKIIDILQILKGGCKLLTSTVIIHKRKMDEWCHRRLCLSGLTLCLSCSSDTISCSPILALKWQTAASVGSGKTNTASSGSSSSFTYCRRERTDATWSLICSCTEMLFRGTERETKENDFCVTRLAGTPPLCLQTWR